MPRDVPRPHPLLTDEQRQLLLDNGKRSAAHPDGSIDAPPVVKLFTPDGAATWLLSELDPEEPDRAFGLCDMGAGSPEMGYVLLSEIDAVRGALGLPVERDLYTKLPERPLSKYAEVARAAGHIRLDLL